MSQPNAVQLSKSPKKFLKKGEGLKRFAAYKPPLPMSCGAKAINVHRRQTFVKFKSNEKLFHENDAKFLHPDIIYDKSINLSTQVPKIAPPKIMHTPIRPNRQALGVLNIDHPPVAGNVLKSELSSKYIAKSNATLYPHVARTSFTKDSKHLETGLKINNNNIIPTVPTTSPSTKPFNAPSFPTPPPPSPRMAPPRAQQPLPLSNAEPLSNEVCRKKKSSKFDVSTPTPEVALLALSERFQQIEATVNNLKELLKNCHCGAILPNDGNQPSTKTRMTTRSRAKDKTRPSANADNKTNQKPDTLVLETLQNDVREVRSMVEKLVLT